MKTKFTKYLLIGSLSLIVLFTVNVALAQPVPDCSTSSSGFSGWVMCWIGHPSLGIPGASTLFDGQRALWNRLNSIPGELQAVINQDQFVYLVVGGNPKSQGGQKHLLGKLQTGPMRVSFQSAGGINYTTQSIDGHVMDALGAGNFRAYFIPLPGFFGSNLIRTVDGSEVLPSLCTIVMEVGSDIDIVDGGRDIQHVGIQCSWEPSKCSGTGSASIGRGCLSPAERVVLERHYSNSTPFNSKARFLVE